MTALKVCCIASLEEARTAIGLGAGAIGLVSRMPSGPGVIDEAMIAEIAGGVAPPTQTFLLTSEVTVDSIIAQVTRCGPSTVQLVDAVEVTVYAQLRAACPRLRLVQVLHVEDERVVATARQVAPHVDALLLDSGRPSAAVKELGGTGRVHDWALSRAVVEAVTTPVYLAGGLAPHNVAGAIERVRPHGVDVCSGVRTNGRLDADKLAAFVTVLGRPALSGTDPSAKPRR